MKDDLVAVQATAADAEVLLGYVSVDTAEAAVIVSGANLYVTSGSGVLDDSGSLLGLGNLIIGPVEGTGKLTGSHNLMLGDSNDAESHGSIVGGEDNTASGAFSLVLTGPDSEATTQYAVVEWGAQRCRGSRGSRRHRNRGDNLLRVPGNRELNSPAFRHPSIQDRRRNNGGMNRGIPSLIPRGTLRSPTTHP